jgi:hypothetical protein
MLEQNLANVNSYFPLFYSNIVIFGFFAFPARFGKKRNNGLKKANSKKIHRVLLIRYNHFSAAETPPPISFYPQRWKQQYLMAVSLED